jgi:outer membrane protein insertion porin family
MAQACDELLVELERLKSTVNTLCFEGLRAFDESELLRALHEERIVTEGAPLSPDQIEQARVVIKKLMASRGYARATIVPRDEQSEPNVRALTFIVNEGEPIRVAEIRFGGNKAFSSSELSARMRKCLAHEDPAKVNVYDAGEVDFCLRTLDDFARSKGYLQARFIDPDTEETKEGLIITVNANEGSLYKLGEITIDGARAIPINRIRALLRLRTGDIAGGDMFATWLFEDLKRVYGEIGHIQYTAEIEPEFKAAGDGGGEGVVDLKITIEEGRQFRVRAIKFQGSNLSEKESLALLHLRPGDIFNQRLWEENIDELNKLGRFDPIDKDRDADFTTDEEKGLIDIVIKLNNALEIKPIGSSLTIRQF